MEVAEGMEGKPHIGSARFRTLCVRIQGARHPGFPSTGVDMVWEAAEVGGSPENACEIALRAEKHPGNGTPNLAENAVEGLDDPERCPW